jgi:hypothetical protein
MSEEKIPDLAVCRGRKCLMKKECYRYTSNKNKKCKFVDFENICNSENDYKWVCKSLLETQ